MIRNPLILAATLAASLSLSATCVHAAGVPANIKAAVADSNRPDADKERDANRKPAETLEFLGVKPGEKVAELLPGGGYFTRLFSKAVGPKGHVYALVPERPADAPADMPDLAARSEGNCGRFALFECERGGRAADQPCSAGAGGLGVHGAELP